MPRVIGRKDGIKPRRVIVAKHIIKDVKSDKVSTKDKNTPKKV